MKRNHRIPLCDVKVARASIHEVAESLRSGWLTSGPRAARFETEIARRVGVKYAIAVNSATSGLAVALKAAGVRPGTEVITSPYTFIATIEAILYCGGTPVLADVDPQTLTLDSDSVAKLISRRTVAVMPVDIAGHPADYTAIRRVCRAKRIPILSDSAHAFGALYHGKPIPHWTQASVFSFYATKNLTCGEGGMVVSDSGKFASEARCLSRHGMTSNAYQRQRSGGWDYDVVALGFKANMSDLHAAVGLGQLAAFDREQARRRRLVERYGRDLGDLSEHIELPVEREECQSAWHLYIIRLNLSRLKISRNQFIRLMSDRGVECGVHYKPAYELTHYRGLRIGKKHCPNVAALAPRVVTLPLYAELTISQVDFVCDQIRAIVRRHAR